VLGILRLKKKKQKLLWILQKHNVEMVSGTQCGHMKWNTTWECYMETIWECSVKHNVGVLSEILWGC